jgi:hypothetical protein
MRKVKAFKKLSMRERRRRGLEAMGATVFGKIPSGREGVAYNRSIDRFIRAGSCRHKQPLGNPCDSFDADAEGVCKRDGRICDLLTEKGERYLREYES